MTLGDYLVDQAGHNWSELLADWSPPLPASFTLWMVNRFGDVFAVLNDESVHLLDLGSGNFTRLADSQEEFADLIDRDNHASDWLLTTLVDECVAAGLVPADHQCYGFKVPPILGGEYKVENVTLTDLSVHYSFLGDIYRQTRDLRDGTRVRVVVENLDQIPD